MPEGDTLYRVAETLRRCLAGEVVVAFSSPLPALRDVDLEGHRIESVVAKGKNLLIGFDDGRTLHTHLRMNGRWIVYRRGEQPRTGRVSIETKDVVAICFAAPVVRLLTPAGLRRDRMLRALGPDLLGETFDADEALDRLQALASVPLGEAIMDQRTAAGIGNVYKSELLFLGGLDPFASVSAFTRQELGGLLLAARDLMQKNVRLGGPRTTRFSAGSRLWVYDRARRPCLRCKKPILMKHQGLSRRSTYYCPVCQRGR